MDSTRKLDEVAATLDDVETEVEELRFDPDTWIGSGRREPDF
jgi:hypothetical protein